MGAVVCDEVINLIQLDELNRAGVFGRGGETGKRATTKDCEGLQN